MATARVNGVDLYYEMHGSGDAVVLTHGSWSDTTAWRAVAPRLAEQFTVVTWDRRGHSRSSDGSRPGSFREDAGDLAGLIAQLDLAPAHVYGASAGGIVVLTLLGLRPELFMSASVHEPPVVGLLEGTADPDIAATLAEESAKLAHVKEMIEAGDGRAAAAYFLDNVAVGPGAWEHMPEPARAAIAQNAATYLDELGHPGGWVVDTEPLALLDVPTLMTRGTESAPLLLAAFEELTRRVAWTRIEIIEGAGHVPYRTHPDMWIETMAGFFLAAAESAD